MFKQLQDFISWLQGKPSEKELMKRKVQLFMLENWQAIGVGIIGTLTLWFFPTVVGGGVIIALRKWLQDE